MRLLHDLELYECPSSLHTHNHCAIATMAGEGAPAAAQQGLTSKAMGKDRFEVGTIGHDYYSALVITD